MDIEKLYDLNIKEKKELLFEFIENDVSYWKKIIVLLSMTGENEDDKNDELLNLILENKRKEIDLAIEKYGLKIKENRNNDENQAIIMNKIINGSNDINYRKACQEILEILKHIPEEYYNKINSTLIERLEKIADKTHFLLITSENQYEDLEILDETEEILELISGKYWKTDEKKVDICEIFNRKND